MDWLNDSPPVCTSRTTTSVCSVGASGDNTSATLIFDGSNEPSILSPDGDAVTHSNIDWAGWSSEGEILPGSSEEDQDAWFSEGELPSCSKEKEPDALSSDGANPPELTAAMVRLKELWLAFADSSVGSELSSVAAGVAEDWMHFYYLFTFLIVLCLILCNSLFIKCIVFFNCNQMPHAASFLTSQETVELFEHALFQHSNTQYSLLYWLKAPTACAL